MRFFSPLIAIALMATGIADAAPKDEAAQTFKQVIELLDAGDLPGALDEARFGVQQLEAASQDLETAHFKDEVMGYAGGDLDKNNAMGMRITERSYTKDGNTITVTRMAGSAQGAMAGLGMLAQMGGGRPVRVDGRKGTLVEDGGNTNLFINMNSGGSLSFESDDVDGDTVINFAKEFPIKELDEAGA